MMEFPVLLEDWFWKGTGRKGRKVEHGGKMRIDG